MIFRKVIRVCFFLFATVIAKSQESDADKLLYEKSIQVTTATKREHVDKAANDAFPATDFSKAIANLKKSLEKKPDNANLNYKLGLCYFFSYDQQLKAIPYLKAAAAKMTDEYFYGSEDAAPYAVLYFLAECMLENNQPDSAIKYFSMYHDKYQEMPISTELSIMTALNLKDSEKNPRDVRVTSLGNAINTEYAETNPVMRLDNKQLFFASRRPGSKEAKYEEQLFDADIYIASKNDAGSWDNPIPFAHNTTSDEAPLYLSPNGDELYLRRVVKNHTDIFKSTLTNGEWTKPVPVAELNSQYNETGLSITADGKKAFMCSDRSKEGKFDLFVLNKLASGKWGEIKLVDENLVNSPLFEVSPFISPDGNMLFFSSNGSGQKGRGSMDVYFTEFKDGKWTDPVNMGFPVNNSRADINYYVAGNDKRYYASLTKTNSYDLFLVEGGGFDYESIAKGSEVVTVTNEMGVTQVVENEKKVEKEVEVTQSVESIVEKEKEVEVTKTVEVERPVLISDLKIEDLPEPERVKLIKKLQNYMAKQGSIATNKGSDLKNDNNTSENSNSQAIASATPGEVMKSVYFGFNKTRITSKSSPELRAVAEYLKANPDAKVEIVGHCDNKGEWETNVMVSASRARSVYDFLLRRNISPERMLFYGKGEAVPAAPNDNEENMEKNRRVEIILLR